LVFFLLMMELEELPGTAFEELFQRTSNPRNERNPRRKACIWIEDLIPSPCFLDPAPGIKSQPITLYEESPPHKATFLEPFCRAN
jgi:hypothetical protein